MKEQLLNCNVVLVPYWLVDAIRANNEKLSILANYDGLRRILTKGDLEFYAKSYHTLDHYAEGQPLLRALADSVYPTYPDQILFRDKGDREVYGQGGILNQVHDRNSHYMSNAVTQFVRPALDGVVNGDVPYLFELFVISDRLSGGSFDGEITLGVTLTTNLAENKESAALSAASANIELLTKYYGINQVIQTALVNKFMRLKKHELLNPNIMSNNVAVEP